MILINSQALYKPEKARGRMMPAAGNSKLRELPAVV
jgi:hypothetical protein